ncbi:hypothetical protein ACGFNU_21630 [Spirillospora sp. NPDC048911]|uniref:hypothetical protein n=1 Tax=Spirillospora sp. NPDC048911 TaxID=3364527 RepID=UPI00371867FC
MGDGEGFGVRDGLRGDGDGEVRRGFGAEVDGIGAGRVERCRRRSARGVRDRCGGAASVVDRMEGVGDEARGEVCGPLPFKAVPML